MSLLDLFTIILATIGVVFMVISAIGILRLPDIYLRMHAAGKSATLGVTCILLAAGLHFGSGELFRMVLLIALFYVTAPIATTTMARATYRTADKRSYFLNFDDLADAQAKSDRPSSPTTSS